MSGLDGVGTIITNLAFAERRGNNIVDGGLQTPAQIARFAGNMHKAGEAIIKLDSSLGTGCLETTVDAFKTSSSGVAKFAHGVGTVTGTMAKISNPLIIASAGLKIMDAKKDEKLETAIEESSGVAAMFGAEYLARTKPVDAALTKTIVAVSETVPAKGKWLLLKAAVLPVAKAVVFVAASCLGYDIGKDAGSKLTNKTV